jgi:hypothetical protein
MQLLPWLRRFPSSAATEDLFPWGRQRHTEDKEKDRNKYSGETDNRFV